MASSYVFKNVDLNLDISKRLNRWESVNPSNRSYTWFERKFVPDKNGDCFFIVDLVLIDGSDVRIASGAERYLEMAKKVAMDDFIRKFPRILRSDGKKKRKSKKNKTKQVTEQVSSEDYDLDMIKPYPPGWTKLSEEEKTKILDEELDAYFTRDKTEQVSGEDYDLDMIKPYPPGWTKLSEEEKTKILDEELDAYLNH